MAKLYGKGYIKEIIKGKKYYYELSAGRNPVTGQYDKVRGTFYGTRRQTELHIEKIRDELNSGRIPNADKITFAEWLERYLLMREDSGKFRPKTIKQDKSLAKHLLSGLGSVKVVDITPAMIDSLYSSMRARGLGDTTVKQAHKLLNRVMKYAVRNDVITRNPVDRADAPKKPKPNRQFLSIADANRLADVCASGTPTANKTAVYLALATGARLGEVLGLEWRHIVLDGRPFVHIVQQYTAQREIAPLKTDKDDNPVGRIVPIDAATVAMLERWRSVQRMQLNEFGIEQGNSTPVVTNVTGGYVEHSHFEKWWRGFCIDNGFGRMVAEDGREVIELALGDDASLHPDCVIEWRDAKGWPCDANGKRFSRTYPRPKVKRHYDGLHFHALRHTHFSIRLASGMDIPTAQALGGWSTPDVLMTVYAHPMAQNIWASAGFMDRLTATETA